MHYTAAALLVLLDLLAATAADGGGGGLRDVARCSRRGPFSLCQQFYVSAWSDTMFCGAPIVFCIWHAQFSWARCDDIDSVCAMFGANPACWSETMFVVCPLCFGFDMKSFCDQNDDIDSVCTIFRANPACWSAPCFVVCPVCFAPEGLTLRKWVDFTLNGCAHAVGWLHAGWVDLTSAPSNLEILDDEVRKHSGPISEPFFGGTELGQDEVNHQISAWKLVHKPGIQTLCETLFPLVLELI